MVHDNAAGGAVPEFSTFEAGTVSEKYFGATFATYFDEAKYQDQYLWLAAGQSKFSTDWIPAKRPLLELIRWLALHKEGTKDGPAFVFGEMDRGHRKNRGIRACTAIPLDFDTGIRSEELDAALTKLGVACISYTSNSHGKTSTDINSSEVKKFGGPECELNTELLRRYLREDKRWEDWIVATVKYDREYHTSDGYVCRVTHDPMPKYRVIVFLREPFVMRTESDDLTKALTKWGKLVESFAAKLGFNFDRACMVASQPFYLPRHEKGRSYEVRIYGGELCDWRSLNIGENNAFEDIAADFRETGKKSKTKMGQELGRWASKVADGFMIEEFLEDHCPDRIRGQATSGVTIECPNDAAHSNAGNSHDTACFAKNGDGSPFVISCRHSSCNGLTMLDMLGLMIDGGWVDRSAIDDPQYDAIDREKEADHTTSQTNDALAAEIVSAIEKMESSPPLPTLNPIIASIAKLGSEYEEERMLKLLKGKQIKIGVIRTMLIKAKRGNGGNEGVELKYDELGRAIFKYHATYNDDDLANAVRASLKAKNEPHHSNKLLKPSPNLTAMLGIPMKLRVRDGKTSLDELREGAFHAEVSETILMRDVKGAGSRKFVPREVSSICFNTSEDYLPQAPELVRTPLFDCNFNLLREPGWYNAPERNTPLSRTNILLGNDCLRVRAVSAKPSDSELREAVELIRRDLLVDFPFCTFHDGIERRDPAEANAISMLLTPFVRRGIDGHTPMFFVAKPTPGTGGTLLGRLPMIIDGVETVPINLEKGEEEVAKAMLAAIMSSRMCMFFDNVKHFNNSVLLQNLTSKMIGDRLLGQSKIIERPNNYLWVATGNNPIILEEMNRRTVWINLNLKKADVRDRSFKHNIETWASNNRSEIVWALLTMIQAWVSNGKKQFTARTKLSYERWAEIVGGILENAGIEGFLDTPDRVASDQDQTAANELVRRWLQERSTDELSIKQLVEFASGKQLDAWSGKNDEDKKAQFIRLLDSIEGRTFAVGVKQVMVRKMLNRDSDLVFKLVEMQEERKDTR